MFLGENEVLLSGGLSKVLTNQLAVPCLLCKDFPIPLPSGNLYI